MGSDTPPPAEQTDRRKGGLLLHTGRVNCGALYENWIYDAPAKTWDYLPHVVNVGMALKSMALFSRIGGEDPDAFAEKMWQTLMRDHSMASGHFSGDECLAALTGLVSGATVWNRPLLTSFPPPSAPICGRTSTTR